MQKDIEYWNSKERKIFSEYSKGSGLWRKKFQELVWSYHARHRRDFSWRNSITPYRVFVSEYMLQQTQTVRVVDKFREFIRRFPSFTSLANASEVDILRIWSGLGYNRRGLYLHKSARIIVDEHRGRVPRDRDALLALPGTGEGTAAAIRVFAFNIPDVIIETNVRTVYRKVFFPERSDIPDSEIALLVQETMDTGNPREWFYGVVDYGVFLKQNGYRINHVFRGYRPQSRFQGSRREVRGAVIRMLLEQKMMSRRKVYKVIESEFGRSKDDALSICSQLLKEGLIQRRNQYFLL
jgi:A/G-specific adenine glycosylase